MHGLRGKLTDDASDEMYTTFSRDTASPRGANNVDLEEEQKGKEEKEDEGIRDAS